MAINMYLKFEGPEIKGESSAPGYEGQIEILSWSHGFSQPTSVTRSTAGAGTVEQASHQNFNVSKYLDVATNTLLKYCWSGKQIQKATLTCCRPSGAGDKKPVGYLKVIMEHVIIANFTVSGGPGDVPVETSRSTTESFNTLPRSEGGRRKHTGQAQPRDAHDRVAALTQITFWR